MVTNLNKRILLAILLCFSLMNVNAQTSSEKEEFIDSYSEIGWKYIGFRAEGESRLRAPNIPNMVGVVSVRFQVKPNGYVGQVIPLQDLNDELKNEVVNAISKWRFSPLSSKEPQEDQWAVVRLNKEADRADEDEEAFVVVEQMPELIGEISKNTYTTGDCGIPFEVPSRVIVEVIVNKEGKTENVRLVSATAGYCVESALLTMENAEFRPGMHEGKPVRVKYRQAFRFFQ